jgi:steroid delta-isomerase-like uncharacterized protein
VKTAAKSPAALAESYLDAWQRHDIERIVSMHTPDSVFTSVATGREAVGREQIAQTIGEIFAVWPDLEFDVRRRYVTTELIVTESIARATQALPLPLGGETIEPNGRPVTFAVADVFPLEDGLIKRKDSYVDAVNYVRQMKPTAAENAAPTPISEEAREMIAYAALAYVATVSADGRPN